MSRFYDLVQLATGSKQVSRIFAAELKDVPMGAKILDVGGGTGLYRDLCPKTCSYLNLDLDWTKLQGFKRRHPADQAARGSGVHLPLADQSMDICLMIFVSHHLSADDLHAVLQETRRVP